jgi:hypothetical protein
MGKIFVHLRRLSRWGCSGKETPPTIANLHLFHNHDNAPAHRPALVKDFIAKKNVTTLEHHHTYVTWLHLFFSCF